MNKLEPRTLKGFRDYAPKDQIVRLKAMQKIENVFQKYAFLPLSTPVLEYKEILMGKYGDDEKLVYSFTDHGGREIALRYDLTVPLARFVAQNFNQINFPFKRYQIAPSWRADNPQKGRLREFIQCDVDCLGTDSALADAEVILCLADGLRSIGFDNFVIKINSRKIFEGLADESRRSLDKFDKIGSAGVLKDARGKNLPEDQINILQKFMSDDSDGKLEPSEDVTEVIALLKASGISETQIVFDKTIARGLDYYTGIVFEFKLPKFPEYGTVCGGGRYDSLLDQYGKSISAVGGSIGLDRIFPLILEQNLLPEASDNLVDAIVFNIDQKLQVKYFEIAQNLRRDGLSAQIYFEPAKLDKQFKFAESLGAKAAVIIGEEEAKTNQVQVKNLSTREQYNCDFPNLSEKIRLILNK